MIIKNLLAELELQLSDIAFSGLRNIQPVTLQKLEDLKHWMNELNMSEAIRLTEGCNGASPNEEGEDCG